MLMMNRTIKDDVSSEQSSNLIDKIFSPCGADSSRVIVGWVLYDWASSATIFPFSILIPLLLNSLGNYEFGAGSGRILWSYVSVVVAVITALLYMSVTSVIEFGNIKRNVLIRCGRASGVFLTLFVFAFSSGSVYLAAILTVGTICSQRVAGVAYDSLLDSVAINKDAHQISSRGVATAYVGMLVFVLSIAPIILIIYFALHPGNLWIQSIIPIVLCGFWYLLFLIPVAARVPPSVYTGPPIPENMKGNIIHVTIFGLYTGFVEQLKTIRSLYYFPDLGSYIISNALISDGSSAAGSAAVIIASDVLQLSLYMIGVAALMGIFSAVIGIAFFKILHYNGYLLPKQILLINLFIVCLCAVYALFITSLSGVFILVVVAGTQVGPFSSFSRSMFSKFAPTLQQSRFFSLFTFSQKGTSWLAPLVIGALTQVFGSNSYVRVVVLVALAEIAIGVPFLVFVNVPRAEAKRIAVDERDRMQLHALRSDGGGSTAAHVYAVEEDCYLDPDHLLQQRLDSDSKEGLS